jgi:hypothetical protein
MPTTVDDLRRFAVAQSLFPPTTLKRAFDRLGFVQADPIRAPARAQDLMLRHRVKNYRAGDLERRYCKLGIEEDVFINYGFVTRSLQALMHPRSERSVPASGGQPWPAARKKKAQLLLDFVSERGAVHPREVDDHFSHGRVKNYWGGSSNATTHLLDAMHYRGMLRVARREVPVFFLVPDRLRNRPKVEGWPWGTPQRIGHAHQGLPIFLEGSRKSSAPPESSVPRSTKVGGSQHGRENGLVREEGDGHHRPQNRRHVEALRYHPDRRHQRKRTPSRSMVD